MVVLRCCSILEVFLSGLVRLVCFGGFVLV